MPETIKKCTNCGQDFAIIPLEHEILKKLKLPEPDQCFYCRKKRRHKTRMRGRFYLTKCGKCGKDIYVTTDPASGLVIYCKECYMAFKASGAGDKIQLDIE